MQSTIQAPPGIAMERGSAGGSATRRRTTAKTSASSASVSVVAREPAEAGKGATNMNAIAAAA